MTLLTFILQAASPGTAFAVGAAAVLAPFVTHLAKKFAGVDGLGAYGLHLAVSGALAAVVLFLFKEVSFNDFATTAPIIATVATTIFNIFKDKFQTPAEEPLAPKK